MVNQKVCLCLKKKKKGAKAFYGINDITTKMTSQDHHVSFADTLINILK